MTDNRTTDADLSVKAPPVAAGDKPAQRFAPLPQDQMTPAQKAAFGNGNPLAGANYNPNGFDAIMLRNPGLQNAITAAVAKVYPMVAQVYGTDPSAMPTIPQAYVEIGVLMLSTEWKFPAMYASHGPMAIKCGISQEIIDALAKGERPAAMKPDEAAVYDFCRELIQDHVVSDAAFQALRQHISERDVVDLVTSLGLYTNSLMIMKVANSHVH